MRFVRHVPGRGPGGVRKRWALGLALVAAVIGCQNPEPTRASARREAADALAMANAQPGSGVVTGSADGMPFTNAAAFLIENPDLESTTVLYVFSTPVSCLDLSFSEWDRRLAKGTSFLELKISGRAQRQLPVEMTGAPGPGEAVARYARSAAPETSNETRATGGTIALMTFFPRSSATVSFSLAFGKNHLNGNVIAAFCPGGHEP
jgi:hypothetical protein